MTDIQLTALTCKDRTRESGPYGGYTCWDDLMKAMERQRKLPVEKRIRPCLKGTHPDWWIEQVPWCQKCEKAIWHLTIDGEKQKAKAVSINNDKVVELAVEATGEIIVCKIGKRHQPVNFE